jgi:F0F1-type ATP synthase membrane subunit b/b'
MISKVELSVDMSSWASKLSKEVVMYCASKYGFDGEEAITRLLNNEKPKKEKKAKEPRKRKSVASNPEDGEKKKRGRPAKTVKVVEESQVVDMFADIVSKDDVAPEEEHVETPVETPVEPKKAKKTKVLSEEEKEAKEAKKAQEKAEKEAEKEAKKAQEKAEKEAKKAQEKAEKEAKKAEEKALKEAEKEAKKAEKPVKKTKAKTEKKAPDSVESTPAVSDNESETEQEVFKVKKFEHKGVSYLRTRNGDNWHDNGHIYNMEQDLVGFWNEQNQDINFVEEGECVEEEYDE